MQVLPVPRAPQWQAGQVAPGPPAFQGSTQTPTPVDPPLAHPTAEAHARGSHRWPLPLHLTKPNPSRAIAINTPLVVPKAPPPPPPHPLPDKLASLCKPRRAVLPPSAESHPALSPPLSLGPDLLHVSHVCSSLDQFGRTTCSPQLQSPSVPPPVHSGSPCSTPHPEDLP